MGNSNMEQLHQAETELLRRFIRICEENGICYYVIGGTLLGAVRHGGFIPWDDDIDVAVPREDYVRLIQIMRELTDDEIGMQYYRDDPDLYFYPLKIVSKRYRIRDVRALSGYSHPWIDVLPLDGKPDGIIKASVFKIRMDWYRLLLAFCYIDRLRNIDRSFLQRMVITAGKILRPGRWIDPTKVKDKVDRLLSSNAIGDCSMIGTCMGAYYFHEFVPQEYFGKGSKVLFCGIEVNAPEMIDVYLSHMYGEGYMQLPPESERKAAHVSEIEYLG